MRLHITYKDGAALEVEAEEAEELETLVNLGLRILWGKSATAYTLNEIDTWLAATGTEWKP